MKPRILILAGGVASRMKKAAEVQDIDQHLLDQADTVNKGMIGLGYAGRPFIDYLLYNAYKAGMEEVLLLLHPQDDVTQPYYERMMAEGNAWGLQIRFARQHIAPDRAKPAGTADAVYQALQQHPDWHQGRLIVCNSDNLYSIEAMRQLWEGAHANALIGYDRDALDFPEERIRAFALIKKNKDGFLEEITEKPSDDEVAEAVRTWGRVEVSMNIFVMEAAAMLPYFATTPFHPVRNEKELPTTVNRFVKEHPLSFFVVPRAEKVPDLTSKQDIRLVQDYLFHHYQDFSA
ncbi:glucose-1-phosphate thymidylyltransferase/glucose-1-phosphate adenylyltransferase [Catalinimonas alkaloidigena]|uniref:Glucose-1-phosphate thymidylyltransferase/glucose-1-phosphate adenylyltransferase n=1 Tax=Catalinimonas alkaloidigena TaxID=1075417 RepID=A0A1G9J0R0_9BACT|nr:sugar phosphate nucleotidyltransferase [Catalinimonas alkaloidigena]SDL30945.1 glucose-1-phosphate thymidylyltransferase/glucose-1-phosphate adenylyltransferase [Catalinimonas alkaloidigena]